MVYRLEAYSTSRLLTKGTCYDLPWNRMAAICALIAATGCSDTMVGSYRPGEVTADQIRSRPVLGMYMLPKAMIRVQLKEKAGLFTINVVEPRYTGDPKKIYAIHHNQSSVSDDEVEVTIDNNTNLLKSVTSKSDGKLDEFIVESSKNVALLLETAITSAPDEVLLVDKEIDPSDDIQVVNLKREMNRAVQEHSSKSFVEKCDASGTSAKSATKLSSQCASYLKMKEQDPINFEVEKPNREKLEELKSYSNCQTGICIRPAMPYTIGFTFNGKETDPTFSTVVPLPNEMPAISLDLVRSSFVTRSTSVTLDNGMLQKIHIEKPSEALEVVKIPLEVVSAIFGTIATLIQLKFDISTKEKDYAEAELARIKAEKALKAGPQVESSQSNTIAIILQGTSGAATTTSGTGTGTESDSLVKREATDGSNPTGSFNDPEPKNPECIRTGRCK